MTAFRQRLVIPKRIDSIVTIKRNLYDNGPIKTFRYNRCVDTQISMRQAINPQIRNTPGKLHYLKAIEHCEGR